MAESELAPAHVQLTVIEKKVDPIQSDATAISSNAKTTEDEFEDLYFTSDTGRGNVIQPPYDLRRLMRMVNENNTLGQCVAAYEVNIDGTGYQIETMDDDSETDEEDTDKDAVADFFKEPWTGASLTTQRRSLRRDIEGCGNGYWEIIRNAGGQIVFAKYVEAVTMRIVRLGAAVPVKKKVMRAGKELEVTVNVRERAFIQRIGNETIYFKEFGATRDINKKTGEWSNPGQKLPADIRGTEIIHFTAIKDVDTPYGVPRWINQLPSVIGSRQAEELNLDFFDYGGIPPIMILLNGGEMTDESKKDLERILNKGPKASMRAAVLDVTPTGGTLQQDGKSAITVERFGAEQQKDSMYETYDDRCERRVRSAFRIPPLFMGKAEDYSYATAFASYTVSETQVFKPERDEFDEIVNKTIMREIAPEGLEFRSMPLTVHDIEHKIKGLEMAKDSISGEDFVKAINEVADLDLKFDQEAEDERKALEEDERQFNRNIQEQSLAAANGGAGPVANKPPVKAKQPAAPGGKPTPTKKADELTELMDLASDWGDIVTEVKKGDDFKMLTMKRIESLDEHDRGMFDKILAVKMYSHPSRDWDGAEDVCSAASELCAHG